MPEGRDLIPGARGCTPQACAFRDHYRELAAFEAELFGLSTQPTDYQREMAERLHLPFEVLSDAKLTFCECSETSHIQGGRDTAHQATDLDYPWRLYRNRVLSRFSRKRERRASHRVA